MTARLGSSISARRFLSRERVARLTMSIIILALLVIRSYLLRIQSEPWAEDAIDLIFGAIQSPFNIFTPVVDGIMLFQRTVASLAVTISLVYAPLILAGISICLCSLVAIYFTRSSFSWLIPNLWVRSIIALILALGPGTLEVSSNLVCTAYPISLLLLLLSLENPMRNGKILVPAWIYLSFSTPIAFFPIPVLLVRMFTSNERNFRVMFTISMVASLAPGITAKIMVSPVTTFAIDNPYTFILSFINQLFAFGVLSPIITFLGVNSLLNSPRLFWFFGSLVCLVLLHFLLRQPLEKRLIIVALFISPALYAFAHQLGRPTMINDPLISQYLSINVRPAYLLALPPIIGWTILLASPLIDFGSKRSKYLRLIFALQLGTLPASFLARYTMPTAEWPKFAKALEERLTVGCTSDYRDWNQRLNVGPYLNGIDPWATLQCNITETTLICAARGGNRNVVTALIKDLCQSNVSRRLASE